MAFLTPIATFAAKHAATIQLIGTAVGAVSSVANFAYQAALADRQAKFLHAQQINALERGQVEQQDQDLAAAAEIAGHEARQGASGFEVGSTSFERERRTLSALARRDALRIRANADREALALGERAAQAKLEAKAAKTGAVFSAISGLGDIGSDLISSATLIEERKAAAIRRDATRIRSLG